MIIDDLKEAVADVIEVYRQKKIGEIEIDSDTDFEIYKMIESCVKRINEELEDLDEDIDTTIEQMSEPSDYENDVKQDMIARYKDLV